MAWCQRDPDLLLSCGKDNRILCWNPNSSIPRGEVSFSTQLHENFDCSRLKLRHQSAHFRILQKICLLLEVLHRLGSSIVLFGLCCGGGSLIYMVKY